MANTCDDTQSGKQNFEPAALVEANCMNSHSNSNGFVSINGQKERFIAKRQIRRHTYFLLKKIGSPFRERYLAFCRDIGPSGKYFLVQEWGDEPEAEQFWNAVRKVKLNDFPEVIDFQRTASGFVCVLSWVEGIPLPEYIKNLKGGVRGLDAVETVRLISKLAGSISRLHQYCHVIHGDLHPKNIIVRRHPHALIPIDYGSSWSLLRGANRTQGDGSIGFYASPERQLENSFAGPSSDMFSVFVILYELLTEQIPYSRLGGKAGLPENIEHMRNKFVPPSKIAPKCQCLPRSIQQQLDNLVAKGLSLNPEERFASSRDCANALRDMLRILQSPPTSNPASRFAIQVIDWVCRKLNIS